MEYWKYTITELCQAFGISRPTAYRLIRNFEKHGIEGLLEKSKAPRTHPNKTKKEIEDKVVELKGRIREVGSKKAA
jgi:transposase-like protein